MSVRTKIARALLCCLFLRLLAITLPGHAQLVINGVSTVTIVENGGTQSIPIYIDVNNSATNGITEVGGSQGWIVSESEFNMVKWDIGTGTGSYVVPFGYSTTNYIPLTCNIITAGSPSTGTILFSTYHTSADNWTCCPPSDVTQMAPSYSILSAPTATDDSYWVVDRFWIIDANTGYSTKPSPNLKFTYIDAGAANETTSPNIFTESLLLAQRFNSTLGTWSGYLGTVGTDVASPPTGTCQNDLVTSVTPADFFRSWTLSGSTDPLPIQLTSYNVTCVNNAAVIAWTSATETNNDHYTVERTSDGITYETIATAKGAGNSNIPHNYSVTDENPLAGTSYYRLSQTDVDGKISSFPVIAFEGCEIQGTTVSVFNSNGNVIVRISAAYADTYVIALINTLGQTIRKEQKKLPAGYNEFILKPVALSSGIYLLNVRSDRANYSSKLVLGNY